MDEEQARETEAEETREEESGNPSGEETAQEQQQDVEGHDWDAMTARIDALEQQVQGLAAAMATISAAAEEDDDKPDAEMPDEYGAAIDLDDEDLAGMLGL
jgi:hypothetical protein